MRISDWSSDVCSSDLPFGTELDVYSDEYEWMSHSIAPVEEHDRTRRARVGTAQCARPYDVALLNISAMSFGSLSARAIEALNLRSEEHTSELQSLMRNSYAVFCLQQKKQENDTTKQTS